MFLGASLVFDIESFLKQGIVIAISPTDLLVGWGEMEFSAAPFENARAFYVPDFFLKDEEPFVHFEYTTKISREGFIDAMGFVETPALIKWQAASPLFFKEQFLYIKELISLSEIKKAVSVSFEKGDAKIDIDFKRYLLSQLARSEAPQKIYGFWNAKDGILGLTPEILFDMKNKYLVQSMALAGTRGRDDKKRLPLLSDNKELNEHYLVIDDIVHVLELWGVVKTQPTDILTLPHLEHLKTDIECKLRQPKEFIDIVKALHPTPALGVSPRSAMPKWLEQINIEERGRFGAPFGVRFEDGTGVCLVAIRNLQWNGNKVILGAGSGIVRESEFDREWDEQRAKRESVKKLLGL